MADFLGLTLKKHLEKMRLDEKRSRRAEEFW